MERRVKVELAYGETGLVVDLPSDRTTVVVPRHVAAVADERAAVLDALRRPTFGAPLRERLRPGQHVAISICDGTRPQPRRVVVPALLDELEGVIDADDVVVIVATGTHRGNTAEELELMLGRNVLDRVRVINHDARETRALRWIGRLAGDVPVWLNAEWIDADVRITTGFVEPHFFAGFSGGPKMVAPGLAGLDTVLALHDARRIGDDRATWGITVGIPVHDAVRSLAAATGVDFALDVLLDRQHRIVAVFAGDLLEEHAAACEVARRVAMVPVASKFDVVITTNAGHPLDQNLYQCVKGMAAGAGVLRPGGTLICVAECRDGFPDHGGYRDLLASAPSPEDLLHAIEARTRTLPDQWQVQVQARVQSSARVLLHTSGLTAHDLAAAHLGHTGDVGATVLDELSRLGPDATVCALPLGPQTIPYVEAT
jgi:nickel-dependent lactate racemase